jgi:hypothetical protein
MAQEPASPRTSVTVGAIAAAVGLYFTLAGFGLVPPPGKAHAPGWVVVCAGLVFLLGGVAAMLGGLAGADGRTGELPASAPRWLRAGQSLLGVAITTCFGLVGTWIAIGPGDRKFTGTFPIGETGGRIVFGVGALMIWLFAIALARRAARELFGRIAD